MATGLSTKNKLHVSWSDSAFFPWLNETTVLDYFCDTRNPFYNIECNNQLLKMQGINPEQLTSMIGYEYQLYTSQPPLYVIRKVQRTSYKEVIPLSYYYILHGNVYQAPDLMSVLSSRLHMTSHYLAETLEKAFDHYKYNPSKGYHWDFHQKVDLKQEEVETRPNQFQIERVDLLLHDFALKFAATPTTNTDEQQQHQQQQQNVKNESDQPVEKKMKL